MMNTNFNEMDTVKAEKELKHTAKFQGNMMPLGDWIIATRWAWDFDKEAMGYQAFLYSYLTDECSSEAQLPSQSPVLTTTRALRVNQRLGLGLWTC